MNDAERIDVEEEIRRRILAERTIQNRDAQLPSGPANPSPEPITPQPYYAAQPPPQNPSLLQRKQQQGGVIGAIAGLLLLLAKIGAPVLAVLAKLKFLLVALKFGKVALTLGSMLLSMWVYAKFYGWPFGIGMVLLIFVHECGHALAARMRGIHASFMVFIPFMGGLYAAKRAGKDVVEEAFIGIMGPVVGTLGALVCVGLYFATGSLFWLALASWGFFVNLFNLAPTAPLDGGWITPVFSPKLLAVGVVLLILVGFRNPFIWILGLMSLPRIIGGWKADPKTQPYYQATAADRWRYALAYIGLIAFLGVGWYRLHIFLRTHHPYIA